jgi:predicted ArsR family transcriptional regulator
MMKGESESQILDLLKKEGLVSTKRISQELGMDLEAAKPVLNHLWEEQKIGRKLALDASSADAAGGAELWHIVGWKAGPASAPDSKPAPQDSSLALEVRKRKPKRRHPASGPNPLRDRIVILETLAGRDYPLGRSDIGKGARVGDSGVGFALSALVKAGLVSRTTLGGGQGRNCPTCGAPLSGRELYRITEEGTRLVRWLRDNKEPVGKLQATLQRSDQ